MCGWWSLVAGVEAVGMRNGIATLGSSGGRQESRRVRHPGFWEGSESSGEVGRGRACWWSGRELEGREGTALASQTKEGDGGECGEKAEVDRGTIYKSQKSLAVYVHVVQAEIGVQTGGGGGCWGGWRMHWRHRSVTVGRRERTYARSMFMGLVTRASRGCRVKESQRWVWRSFAWARQKNAWATNGPRVGP